MSEKPLITIVIPVYNVVPYIDRCVESVRNQTYQYIEILLVDDGSTDGSGRLCDQFAQADARITVIHQQNGGLSDARNAGLACAKGEYIVFIDSDDYIETRMIEDMYTIAHREKADIVEIDFSLEDVHGHQFKKRSAMKRELSKDEALKEYFAGNVIENVVWNKLYKREVIHSVRFEKGQIAEDILFTYRALQNATRVYVDTTNSYYYYSIREGSIVHTLSRAHLFDAIDASMYMYQNVDVSLKEWAFAKVIREQVKAIRKILLLDTNHLYETEKKELLRTIRSYPFLKAVKYLRFKQLVTLYIMKGLPQLYAWLYKTFQKQ